MERAGVVRMPRCCHSVIREPGNGMFEAYLYAGVRVDGRRRSCCDLGGFDIRKRPEQADVTGRRSSTKKEWKMKRVDGTDYAL